MTKQNTIVGVLVAVLVIIGVLVFGSSKESTVQGVSSVGQTNSTGKIVSITMAPLTGAATSSSVLNSAGTDYAIEDTFVSCNTVGNSHTFLTGNTTPGGDLVSWTLQMATTSVANLGLQGNTVNLIANNVVSTSTADAFTASSTNPFPNPITRIWPVNTYITFLFNATNTAACTVGADIIAL